MFNDQIDKTDNKKLLALEKTIEEGLRTFTAVGSALLQIRDGKLYRPQYGSFEEYCLEKWDMDHSHAYRLMKSAEVVENLRSSPIGELLPANEAQTRPLALLTPEQQVQAWQEATEKASNGKQPTGQLLKRIAVRIRAKTNEEKRQTKISEGWTHEELKNDKELLDSLTAIAAVYGNTDAKAIREGIIGLERDDVLFLAKLPKEKMLEIQEFVTGSHWKPKQASRFVNRVLDDDTRISELIHRCLGSKPTLIDGKLYKFFTVDLGGFTITCKAKRDQAELDAFINRSSKTSLKPVDFKL